MIIRRTYNWSGLEKVIETLCDEAYAAGLEEGIKVAAPVVVSKEDGIAIGYRQGFEAAREAARTECMDRAERDEIVDCVYSLERAALAIAKLTLPPEAPPVKS
jgi:flagellar biosynthesis/type III secretory pathway protein FliH